MQRKRRGFFEGGWGLAPLNVLGGQLSALLTLPKAGKFRNPYCDTLTNSPMLGSSHSRDTHVDPKGRLPIHTFQSSEKPRKRPLRPALPGAVTPDRCRS